MTAMQMPCRSPSATSVLKSCPRWQDNLGGNAFGRKILGLPYMPPKFVTDSDLIQQESGIRLLSHRTTVTPPPRSIGANVTAVICIKAIRQRFRMRILPKRAAGFYHAAGLS